MLVSRSTRLVLVTAGLAATTLACADGGSRDVTIGSPTGPSGPIQITAPTVESPTGDAQLTTLRPTFTVRNSTSGTPGTRTYEFQVSDRTDFSSTIPASGAGGYMAVVGRVGVPEGASGTTSYTPDQDLQPATRMYWRARALQDTSTSDWSATGTFRTRIAGFNRSGELYDPLTFGDTIGTASGSTTFVTGGIRVNDANSFVRYQLASTLTSGEFSVEVEGLAPNNPGAKSRIFSMMDGGTSLFLSPFLFNVQYRGVAGNPDNAISYKVLNGGEAFKFEPDFGQRSAGIRFLTPSRAYLWRATWGTQFRLTIIEGGLAGGPTIYDFAQSTTGTYNPNPHVAYLGANDAASPENGSYPGAVYRNLWVGNRPRPTSLGTALVKR